MKKSRVAVAIAALALPASGCSISTSASASSESVSRIVSSSSPSGEVDREEEYRDDVADATVAFVRSGGEMDAFLRQIGALAERHGISDWEDRDLTYRAVGAGLARTDLTADERRAFANDLTGGNEHQAGQVRRGYEMERSQ